MPSFDDVRRLALALPETHETTAWGNVSYKVRDASFVWERPLNKADLQRWGPSAPPTGPIIAARVPDLEAKELLVETEAAYLFTIAHFNGFAAVLCRLEAVPLDRLEELITDAWVARAPMKLAKEFLTNRGLE